MANVPNLDNQNTTKPVKTADEMDIEDVLALETDEGESDDTDADEGDELEEGQTESEPEESDESEESEETPAEKPKHKNTPEQSKIVKQLRTIKELEAKVASLEAKKAEEQKSATKDQIKANYVKAGYDEDTATEMAETKMELMELRQGQKAVQVALDNAETIAAYPNSKKDMGKIIGIMDKTGFDFEQVCLAMYGKQASTTPSFEQAAKQSVLNAGKPAVKSSSDPASRLARSSEPVKGVALTQAERAEKAEIEKYAGTITDERFKELKQSFS